LRPSPDHLDTLHASTVQASTEGNHLIHRDVRAASLWRLNDRLVLVDWASAVIGDPWLDHHLWPVALHAGGGPAPETGQGPHAAGHAALIAGQQPLLTPARDANPALFVQRRCWGAVVVACSDRGRFFLGAA
jgi:aminoglycoside phosphotransferase (APT) family kinase protein